ncbi:MAG TPA: HAMP domain-containing sensor histidine kinase [Brumimicrobium sp.]|nr:HAMP domain-containing sensor histidine kinase [Brumimicrobium sp.]
MNRRTINAVIIIGILSIISILFVQVFWIQRTIKAQKDALTIQERQDSLSIRQFEESVRVALRNAVEEIGDYQTDSSDVYGAVKQRSSNYFLVNVNENLHPYYLEQVLKRKFYEHGINESFQYGIYDCYNDSIVYGNLIRFTRDSLYSPINKNGTGITSPALKWEKDGHYFTVYFPNVISQTDEQLLTGKSPWLYLAVVVGLILVFFGFSVSVMIRQKRISEVKTDFVNNMTHELKTPISTIGLSSELLMQADFSQDVERLKRYAEIIFKENKRLEQQVERVLNMAKLDRNQLKLEKENIDIHQLIEEIADDIDFNCSSGSIQLNLNANRKIVNVDVVHITNILFNLLDNAVKYSEDSPEVLISTYDKDNGIEVSISDSGIGIPKDHISHVFEQFYRVPTGDTHNVKGFGLGLYYVKIIIDSHKGKINVASKVGKGTTFTIWLPKTHKK